MWFCSQNQQFAETGAEESVCRLYEVGKLRDAEDDQVSGGVRLLPSTNLAMPALCVASNV